MGVSTFMVRIADNMLKLRDQMDEIQHQVDEIHKGNAALARFIQSMNKFLLETSGYAEVAEEQGENLTNV
jgi:hypothetical protein